MEDIVDIIEKTVGDYVTNNIRSGDFSTEKGVKDIAAAHPEWDKAAIKRAFEWRVIE